MSVRSVPLHRLALAAALAVACLSAPASARTPAVGPPEVFASGLAGPEGLAFTRDGRLIVGSAVGDVMSFAPDGTGVLLATVPAPLAGITVLSDGRVLAGSVPLDQVWAISRDGEVSLFAEGIGGPNFIVQTLRSGRIYASASNSGDIVEITGGEPRVVAAGLDFPNGLATDEALGGNHLYVALTLPGQVVRLALRPDGSLGEPELWAEDLPLVDGIAFDRAGNLLAVGLDVLRVVTRSGEVIALSEDPLLDWPANLAFGQGPGFDPRDIYLANFGPGFGDGMDVVRLRYSERGAPLASLGLASRGCTGLVPRRGVSGGGLIRCPSGRRLARR